MDSKLKIYHGAVTTAPLCKNGSEKFGVTASTKVVFGPTAMVIEFDMYGQSTEDAKQKLLNFLSDKGQVDLEQISFKEAMTKKEAMLAMKLGERVTHEYFLKNEYIRLEESKVIDENGFSFKECSYWQLRTDESYDNGWSVIHVANG